MSFEVKALDGKGNACVATHCIQAGEKIFSERPQFHYIFNETSKTNPISSLKLILCSSCRLYFIKCSHRDRYHCQCGNQYCSNKCRHIGGDYSTTTSHSHDLQTTNTFSSATSDGHRWLCHIDDKLLHDLNQHQQTPYFLLALQIYAIIAEDAFQFFQPSKGSLPPQQSDEHESNAQAQIAVAVSKAASDALSGYHNADYCLSLHAFRTQAQSRQDIDMQMFETLLGPAYFESHLRQPLQLIKKLLLSNFTSSAAITSQGNDVTTDNIDDDEEECRRLFMLEFVECDILKEQFFRNMLGIFSTNNLTINISPTNRCSDCDICIGRSINSNDENPLNTIHTMNQSLTAAGTGTGTGLYPTYSKMNHSCECNTINSSCNTEISVYASRDIQVGGEEE